MTYKEFVFRLYLLGFTCNDAATSFTKKLEWISIDIERKEPIFYMSDVTCFITENNKHFSSYKEAMEFLENEPNN